MVLRKKAMLYGKINFNLAKWDDINLMSKTKAPFQNKKYPYLYYKFRVNENENGGGSWQKSFGNFFVNFYLGSWASYVNSDIFSVPTFLNNIFNNDFSQSSGRSRFILQMKAKNCLEICFNNLDGKANDSQL